MRVVVDTNTLVSGALGRPGSPPTIVVDAWRDGLFTLVVSPDIKEELTRTLANPYFATRLSPQLIEAFLDLLDRTSVEVKIAGTPPRIATHPEDDLILEAAVLAQASYLVTGDKKLLGLASHRGVQIVSARQFQDLMPQLRKGGGNA